MTSQDPNQADQPPVGGPPTSPAGASLDAYLAANRGRYTDEALADSARAAGHTDAAISAAMKRLGTGAAEPVRPRARRIVILAYVLTFVVLVAGMALNNPVYIAIGGLVLLVSLLIGLGLSLLMVRSAGPAAALPAILAGPVIVLLILAGICVATGLPIRGSGTL